MSEPKYELIYNEDDPCGSSVHNTWEQAADAAVKLGWASWTSKHKLTLHDGVTIKAIREDGTRYVMGGP